MMLENKALEPDRTPHLKAAMDDLMEAFEAYKETNDSRLSEIEAHGKGDAVTEEKLARIDEALDRQERVIATLSGNLGGAGAPASAAAGGTHSQLWMFAHKTAFSAFMRKGESGPLDDLESKSLSVGSEADGGYLVPDETELVVNQALRAVSPMRGIASVRAISTSVLKRRFATSGAGAGWVGEAGPRPQTGTPQIAELAFPTMELYAMPAATSALLDDAAVDIDQWLAEEIQLAFGQQEGQAFIIGDGTNKPRGLLGYPTTDNSEWSWGTLGTVSTGVDGGLPEEAPADKIIELIYAVKAGYRSNARFLANRLTQSALRKLKDGDGSYLWNPPLAAGGTPSLMGFPVTEAEDMPDIAAGSLSLAFGDFRRGYLVVDRRGIRVMRDPYTAKPYVLFYATKRVGGGVQDFEALKLLRFAAG